jgi:hypothetical protein
MRCMQSEAAETREEHRTNLFEQISVGINYTGDKYCVFGYLAHPRHCLSLVILLCSSEGKVEQLGHEAFT